MPHSAIGIRHSAFNRLSLTPGPPVCHAAAMTPPGGLLGHEMDDDHLRRAANPTGKVQPGGDDRMIKVGGREVLLTRAKADAFRGSNWFFWIAGLSAVNAVILWFSANVMLLVGLGFLLFCHGFGTALGAQLGSTTLVPALTILMEALL